MEASGYHSGIKIALGHTIVELPLIILLALSIFEYSSFTLTEESLRVIGLIGGNTLQHESVFYHLVANGRSIYLGLLKVLLFYFHLIRGWIMPGWQLQHI